MTFLERFLAGEIQAEDFRHADHVRAGYELLADRDFLEAASAYCRVLKMMTARIGKPEAFHQTVTLAFLALIAERAEIARHDSFEEFASANPDLMDKGVLARWYRPERLNDTAARRSFVLPDPAR
ncbi:MAG: hypothetical protein ABI963_02380 [Rhizomicrobium sp.]